MVCRFFSFCVCVCAVINIYCITWCHRNHAHSVTSVALTLYSLHFRKLSNFLYREEFSLIEISQILKNLPLFFSSIFFNRLSTDFYRIIESTLAILKITENDVAIKIDGTSTDTNLTM